MSVSLIDLPLDAPVPQLRWRALTYDRYMAHGWRTSPTRTWEYEPGHPAVGQVPAHHRLVRQKVRMTGGANGLAYAAGSLAVVDRSYRVAWRARQSDAFGATVEAPIYEVRSLVPLAGSEELRSAGSDYPDWVHSRYLTLPEGLPQRVAALARDLTATEPTPFDRAVALESYLRSIPYTLDVPAPPPERDVVDWFLFDLRKGYCDYYASAMVVLARAAGLPARLVVGYWTGTPERAEGIIRYLVTEADAHAWVEVFFPDYGWLEFDPTAGRPAIERPEQAEPGGDRRPGAAVVPARGSDPWPGLSPRSGLLLAGGLSIAALGAAGWLAIDAWRLRRLPPRRAAGVLYGRLRRQARRMGAPRSPGETPYEFLQAFAGWLEADAAPSQVGAAVSGARRLVELQVRASYGPSPPGPEETAGAVGSWRGLAVRLSLLRLLSRWPRRASGSRLLR